MSRYNKFSEFNYTREPIGLGPEATFKYGIPYEWGALHVTNRADEAYGFVPLTADMVKEGEVASTGEMGEKLRADIYLMSPEEFIEQESNGQLPSTVQRHGLGFSATSVHREGVEVRLALSKNTEDFRELLIGGVTVLAEQLGDDIDNVVDEDDIPITEAIEQNASQALMHSLCSFAAEVTQESIAEFAIADVNRVAINRSTKIGVIGLAGAGISMGIQGLAHKDIDIINAGIAATYAGGGLYLARRSMKRFLEEAPSINQSIHELSSGYAEMVAGDIHETYCTKHFDQQAEAMFSED